MRLVVVRELGSLLSCCLQSVKDNFESLERTAWETYRSLFLEKTTLLERTDTLSY